MTSWHLPYLEELSYEGFFGKLVGSRTGMKRVTWLPRALAELTSSLPPAISAYSRMSRNPQFVPNSGRRSTSCLDTSNPDPSSRTRSRTDPSRWRGILLYYAARGGERCLQGPPEARRE